MSPYRVDTVPSLLRPLLEVYGYAFASLMYAYLVLLRWTVRVEIEGAENLSAGANYIFCLWHESVPICFLSLLPPRAVLWRGRHFSWMQHPSLYMKPIHVLLRCVGVRRLALGSTGHGGRHAAEELVHHLGQGFSTVLLPDGPGGPPRVLKHGVLHIASASGVPIVPLRLSASRTIRWPAWDRKQFPLPFSRLRIRIGLPIRVSGDTLDEAERRLLEALEVVEAQAEAAGALRRE
jgi:lysophospholipid acyltransferase (LPLAT)-like uncharacterized protein